MVLANLRPGGMARFGLSYDELAADNPGLVYLDISGFGSGAGAGLAGYDPLVQAVGGLMSVTGPDGGPPTKVGVAVVDVLAGLYSAIAVLAALQERERSGAGQYIELTLLGTVLAALANQSTGYLNAGVVPRPLGNSHPSVQPFGTYRAADGDLMLCAGNDGQFAALARELGMPELATSPRFETNTARVENNDELREWIERGLAARPVAEWSQGLAAAGVPAGAVEDLEGAFALAERLGIAAVDDTGGVRTPAFPAAFSRTPAATRAAAAAPRRARRRAARVARGRARRIASSRMATVAAPTRSITDRSGIDLGRAIRARELTSREVVEAHLDLVRRREPAVKAFAAERFDAALEDADAADARIDAAGGDEELPPLLGVPCTIKESIQMAGMPNAAGVVARRDFRATENAPTVDRLLGLGAIPLGVTNTSELTLWVESENRLYGRTNNAYDRSSHGGRLVRR